MVKIIEVYYFVVVCLHFGYDN